MTSNVELSNHAKRRRDELFPEFNLIEEFKLSVSCSNDEIYRLKSTPSYKRLKKSKKKLRQYRKSPDGSIFFVAADKVLKSGKRITDIVTVIDMMKKNESFVSEDFEKEMIRQSFELQEKTKKPKNKKKQKIRPDYEQAGNLDLLFEGQKRLLKRLIHINDQNKFNYKFKMCNFDLKKHTYAYEMMGKLNKLTNQENEIKGLVEKLKDKNLTQHEKDKCKSQLKSKCLSVVTYMKGGKTDFDFDFDFLSFQEGQKQSKPKRAIILVFARIIKLINNVLFDVLDIKFSLANRKNHQSLMKIVSYFLEYKDEEEKLEQELSFMSVKLMESDKELVLKLIESKDSNTDIYIVDLKQYLMYMNIRRPMIPEGEHLEKFESMYTFISMINKKIEEMGLIKAPISAILNREVAQC